MAYEGTPYQHPEEGYVDSVRSITLDDVRGFYRAHYRRGNVTAGVGGGYPDGFPAHRAPRPRYAARRPPRRRRRRRRRRPATGLKVLLVDKETDASAISFGFPIACGAATPTSCRCSSPTRISASTATRWGASTSAIREARGMNYGNYSYIEAFPAGYATQQPRVNVARRSQLFEIWIRPVSQTAPGNLHDRTMFAIRAARRELKALVEQG